jgi:hypothetical protein
MKVVTAVVNNPVFIEIQYYTLKKYMKCDYEFIVFNDAKDFCDFTNGGDITIKTAIQDMCKKFNIQCININNQHHANTNNRFCQEPSHRTADSMNFILEYQKQYPDYYLLLDSDMFLIDDYNIDDYKKYDCSVVLQHRKDVDKTTDIYYIWNGLYYFNIHQLDTSLMNWGLSYTTDTGGKMTKWLKTLVPTLHLLQDLSINHNHNHYENIENNKVHFMKYLKSGEWDIADLPPNLKANERLVRFLKNDIRNIDGNFFCELYDNKFFHYRAGGNWEKRNFNLHVDLSYQLKHIFVE